MTETERSEVVVRRRADGATELRVGGVFVMDDVETRSERILAEMVLEQGARRVLVGGLGLGYTTRTLLDGGAERVVVAELHPEVTAAVQAGAGAGPLDDARLEVRHGDVGEVLRARFDDSLDAVLLDVDNGPDALVHERNAALYEEAFLYECARVLAPGGSVAIWSMADSTELRARLATIFATVETRAVGVSLQGRDECYWILLGQHAPEHGR